MIVFPERKIVLLATPRTGSRAIKEAVLEEAERRGEAFSVSKLHHPFPHEVPGYGYEKWTIIRDPLDQLKSWITHADKWDDPTDFIKTYKTRYFFYEGGMNIYSKLVDRYFVYEDQAHKEIWESLGYKPKDIPIVGRTDSRARTLTEYQEALAQKRFYNDFKLYYNTLLEREKRDRHGNKHRSKK